MNRHETLFSGCVRKHTSRALRHPVKQVTLRNFFSESGQDQSFQSMPASGPERTFQPRWAMSAFGPNADSISSLRAFPLMTHCRHGSQDSPDEKRLLRFNTCELDDLGPFLGFVGDQLAEVGWRAGEHRAPQICKARLHIGIS